MNPQEWLDPKNWLQRRRYLYAVTVFTMAAVAVAELVPGLNATVAEGVVGWGFGALTTFTATYVFGAVWDHASIRAFTAANAKTKLGADAAAPAPQPTEGTH